MPATRTGRSVGPSSLWEDESGDDPQPLKASWDPMGEPPRPSTRQRPARTGRRRSAFGWFIHHYGWRAYAIPVLLALTVVVIIQVAKEGVGAATGTTSVASQAPIASAPLTPEVSPEPAPASGEASEPAPAPSETGVSEPVVSDTLGPDPNGTYAAGLASGALPDGTAIVPVGAGTWHVAPGTSEPVGSGPEKVTYSIEIEDGLQDPALDVEFVSKVEATLNDPRSWIASGKYTLQRVDTDDADFSVALTSQMTTRDTCGWSIQLESSCYFRGENRVVINDARWTRGAVSYHGDLGSYRTYAINHEVGHALGYQHQPCGENNGLAPVMMQQSWSTSNDELAVLDPATISADGAVCNYNPYPYPRGNQSAEPTG